MEFSRRKLSKDALPQLFRVRIDSVKPYSLMLAPVYLYLKENQKFVSVKGPLDFFTPEDLSKLSSYKYFYLPQFVTSTLPFRQAAREVRELLLQNEQLQASGKAPERELSPFEISDQVLQRVGPLWWQYPEYGAGIEPYLITVFVQELCEPIPHSLLLSSRDSDLEGFDRALFRSSCSVFLALLCGYCDLSFLNALRLRVFEENRSQESVVSVITNEVDELISFAYLALKSSRLRLLRGDFIKNRPDKIAQKLKGRIERIEKHYMNRGSNPPTVFGDRGFIDV